MSLDTAAPRVSRPMIMLLAVACGVTVANVYFPQAIIPLIASGLGVSRDSAALVATASQFGYAAGIFLLVPLGDRIRHRTLLTTLLVLTGLGLVIAGVAPTLPVLLVASAAVGLTTVVPQIIIPMAAGLVSENRRGAITGTLLGGLIGGILLARTFSGTIGEWLDWRVPYLLAAVLAFGFAIVLRVTIPKTNPTSRQSYPALLATPLRLFRDEPELRRSCFYQATMFGGFTAAWTSVALLITGSDYDLDTSVVGLLALVGAASVFCTPIAGRWSDRRGSDPVNLLCFLGALAAAAILLAGNVGGFIGLAALAVGMLALDVAMQSGQVANQARIFALRPDARARLNTAYMTCAFLGGTAGSWLGVQAYVHFGWTGVCALVGTAAALGLGRHTIRRHTTRPPAPVPEKAGHRA
ncbi:MFS transporter [Nocardia pseudobrasiliensis]|uniref:Putative MFS family arabinose efflux permease n=1 Tax=Nocardia pseudobrasiliensis TaxID=45979 RepID=A0A370I949_9NOCA|nr:MFS transporter [Nocardia pseudobrasiliensis]RDI67247.1 putative MFS family arabinose efflux permease [Nocardia pseudobrasiliensis]